MEIFTDGSDLQEDNVIFPENEISDSTGADNGPETIPVVPAQSGTDADLGAVPLEPLPQDENKPEIEPTVTPVPVTPVPVTPVPVTEYDLDDLYSISVQIEKNQEDMIAISKQNNTLFIIQLFVICVICGFLLARIVWRKM